MADHDTKTSTGTTVQSGSKKKYSATIEWLKIWWPVILLIYIFVIAGISKYFYHENNVYSIMTDLIKAMGVLMVVVYVIYTRLLAIETKKMAEASVGLYASEKGAVKAELMESTIDYDKLPEKVKNISKTIHVSDKKFTEDEYNNLITEKNLPAITLKIKNMSGRRIEASKIDYQVRHTGIDFFHSIVCDVEKIGTILPWENKEIPLIIAPEGEVEIKIQSFDYLDGERVQRIDITESFVLPRIRKPEQRVNAKNKQ